MVPTIISRPRPTELVVVSRLFVASDDTSPENNYFYVSLSLLGS